MFVALAMLCPAVLFLLLIAMEHLEKPLLRPAPPAELESFLAVARPEEVEVFMSHGYQRAIQRYWRRRRLTARPRAASGSVAGGAGPNRPVVPGQPRATWSPRHEDRRRG